MKPLRIALLLLFFAGAARAQTEALGGLGSTFDAEHFHSFRVRGGAFLRYDSPYQYLGIAAQTTEYAQGDWRRGAPAALFLWRKQQRDTLAGTIAEAGVVRAAGRVRLIGDATWDLRPNARTGFELIAAGDLVETQAAIDRGIAYSFLAASAERDFTNRLTAIALIGNQRFTDGNDRVHVRGRLIWMLVPEQGISVQLRWRGYQSSRSDVNGAYFNPRRYRQLDAGLFIRKRHAGWMYSGSIAPGSENVIDTHRTTGAMEFRAEGPFWNDARLVAHASYNRSAGYAIADRYWYGAAGVAVMLPIGSRR